MAFSRKILQLFNGICNIMVSPNVRNLIFATIVSLFFKPHIASSILMHWFQPHMWEKTDAPGQKAGEVNKKCGSHKHWFLIHDAMQLGFLCLCTMQYKWPLFPIQLVFCAFYSASAKGYLCIEFWLCKSDLAQNVISYICYADHRLLTKPFDNFQHLPLDAPLYWKGGAMHDLMSPYRH